MDFAPQNHPETLGNDILPHFLALLASAWSEVGQVPANDTE